MTINSNNIRLLIAGAIAGSLITLAVYGLMQSNSEAKTDLKMDENKPLYWVAPMDVNYRRDKPGKSPMGMDLVPVYKNGGSGSDMAAGTIKISPQVVNNLGVRTVTAKMGVLQSQITTVGYVKYDEEQLVHIHPRVEGWIEKLYVKSEGDPVDKGQPLYEIYSPALVNAQEELLLALDRNNQRLIQAAEERLNALQLPQVAIKQLKQSRQVKQRITFFAPQQGVIDNLNIREGFFVQPGTTLMSIGRLEQVWVEAEVFERQALEVAVGIPVTMTLAYLPGKAWQGKVDYVYPTLNAKNRTVKVRLRFDNQLGQLKPNMFAQVIIHAQDNQESLLVPREAVIRSGQSDRVVLALGDGRFKSIEVKTGRFDQSFAEILSGLNDGQRVVISAQFLLDSESSKSADFKRMDTAMDNASHKKNSSHKSADKMSNKSATVDGIINSIDREQRILNISRGPIEKWRRKAATVDFKLAEQIDITPFNESMKVKFTFHRGKGEFVISKIEILAAQKGSKSTQKSGAEND